MITKTSANSNAASYSQKSDTKWHWLWKT